MNHPVICSNTNTKRLAAAIAICCSLLLVLPSCGIPNLRLADPGRELPESSNDAINSENSSQVAIEEFFNDPTLTSLIHQSLIGNQELKILAEEVQVANNTIMARQGAYLPFIFFGATAGIDRPSLYTPAGAVDDQLFVLPGRHFPNPLPNYALGPTFFWTPDIWGGLHAAKDAAALRFLGSADGRSYVVTRMVAEIAENYYGLMALDKRLEILDQTIALQEQSLKVAQANKAGARGTELGVQRFQAEVRKNQSQKLIVTQEIIETENRINFLIGRFPQPVERVSGEFVDLNLHTLSIGVPMQLLQNRPDIRQAERELEAAGLDVYVARTRFLPAGTITAGVGYQAFNPKYLFITPEALIANVVGDLITPLVNKKAIRADYLSANARELQAVYNYQRVILDAFTEVTNRLSKVENYRRSIEIKKLQLASLQASVEAASKLFQNARAEYIDVLLAQRDLMDARTILVETKQEQLSAVVNTYQALGGGGYLSPIFVAGSTPSHGLHH